MKLYVGENLKRLRNEKNITQDAVAEYLGVTYQAVSRWENGLAYPDIEFLPELARFFEVSIEELLGTESNEDKIRQIVSECYELSEENDKPAALSKLRSLEREYPNNWYIKQAICRVLVHPAPESYDSVLPELRRYATEGLKNCTMKDNWHFRMIVSSLVKAVPEEEIKDWIKYIPTFYTPSYNSVLQERYRARNDYEKAKHHGSELILGHLIYMNDQFVVGGESAEDTIISRKYVNDVMNAVIGEPYRKDGKVCNSLMIWERSVYQTQLAGGYAGIGQTEQAIKELEKAVDMWIMQADALKEEYFTSDSPFLEARKNRWFDKFQGVDFCVDAMTNKSDWSWFDSIREDPRFTAQLERILAKKEELEEYFKENEPDKED